MKKFIKLLDEIFFNEKLTCNACGREIFDGGYFCGDCLKEFELLSDGAICDRCGRRTTIAMTSCFTCKNGWNISFARSAFIYEGLIARLIQDYKYNGKTYLANCLLPYLTNTYLSNNFNCDAITFVPSSQLRLYERGFNNSLLLAEKLAKNVNLPLIAPLFKKETADNQVGLSAKERFKNIAGSFGYSDKKCVKDKRVLIVDDVLTTGATSGEMAKMMLKVGAKSVSLITVASVKFSAD